MKTMVQLEAEQVKITLTPDSDAEARLLEAWDGIYDLNVVVHRTNWPRRDELQFVTVTATQGHVPSAAPPDRPESISAAGANSENI